MKRAGARVCTWCGRTLYLPLIGKEGVCGRALWRKREGETDRVKQGGREREEERETGSKREGERVTGRDRNREGEREKQGEGWDR